jgi:hypothetical protein
MVFQFMISRRSFFKALAATAVVSAGGIALIEPAKTFFLPPRCGWGAQRLKIRIVQQYLINTGTEPFRYDGTWVKANGEHVQYHLDLDTRDDHVARMMLEDRMNADWGTPNSDQFILRLPQGAIFGAYL